MPSPSAKEAIRQRATHRQLAWLRVEQRQTKAALGREPGELIFSQPVRSGLSTAFGLAARCLGLLATLRLDELRRTLLAAWRSERGLRRLRRSGLFDNAFYRTQFTGDVGDPVRHYMELGAMTGAWPNRLFDTGYYLARHPDVKTAGLAPLLHYLLTWSSEGRRPNAFFDPRWYASRNPDLHTLGLDPLWHYLTIGHQRGADPAPEFDTAFYRHELGAGSVDVVDPLDHFLHVGRKAGLLASPIGHDGGTAVEAAHVERIAYRRARGEVALFVTHSPDGAPKPHLRPYLQALAAEGIDVVLIVAADRPFQTEPWLQSLVSGLFVRENKGFDFAAWAHLMRLQPDLLESEIVYWLNDSLIGPVGQDAFTAMLARVRSSTADIVGLTANEEHGWHVQSFFLALKRTALAKDALRQFIADIVSLPSKDDVIEHYEVKFVPQMLDAGLTVDILFDSRNHLNPTIFHWRELLQDGFPFVKVMLVRDDVAGADKTGWREELALRGYEVGLVDALIAHAKGAPSA